MKTGKALEEAILRAQQTKDEADQTQEELLHMKEQTKNTADKTQLHESPRNLMQSWHNLRNLDQDLAETKFSDLADDKTESKEKRA